MQEILRMRDRRGAGERTFRRRYRNLLAVADEVVREARVVVDRARVHPTDAIQQRMRLDALATEVAHYVTLTERVIDQTRRRVLGGEILAADAKLYSIFEPHTDLIKRGKVLKPVEFGHKVFLAESGHGLITQYRVLTGNPQDHRHVTPSLEQHTAVFGDAPDLYSADRGFFSHANLAACRSAGVTCACIPQPGAPRNAERHAREHSPAFKQGQRFRAGIEGRISVLFRGRGMKRARVEGREHFELLVGAAVLANNLLVIATLLRRQPVRRRRAAA
jgi:IS5 family transposase